MSATTTASKPLKPFTVIGWSVADEIACADCLRSSVAVTGERVLHICRRNRVHLPEHTRLIVLELEKAHTRPRKIAEMLQLTLSAVLAVISGDADDDATCPACEASKRLETRDILPVYAGDASMTEETCTHCGRHLLTIARDRATSFDAQLEVVHEVSVRGEPAIRFARRPPQAIIEALKATGWRWDPRERHWFDRTRTAALPAGLSAPAVPRVVTARAPVIRHRVAREGGGLLE